MVKATVICGFLSLLTVQGAVLNNGDFPLHRVVRSPYCSECNHYGHPPPPGPPPPPPFFHTHHWTGVERGAHGSNGVFSGAAATAEDGLQTGGQAFSMASSGVGAGAGAASGATSQAGAATGSNYESGLGSDASNIQFTQSDSNDFGQRNSGSFGGGREFKSFKESHYSYGNKHFGGQSGRQGEVGSQGVGYQGSNQGTGYQGNIQSGGYQGSSQHRSFQDGSHQGGYRGHGQRGYQSGSQGLDESIQQTQSTGFDAQSSALAQSSSNRYGGRLGGGYNQGYGSGYSGERHGQYGRLSAGKGSFSSEQEGTQFGSESAGGNEQQLHSSHDGGEWQSGSSAYGSSQQANQDTQSALRGALDLASQGVQAAKQTQPAGCSSCGKSNYALSNAKSHSGNAVAVSVGG